MSHAFFFLLALCGHYIAGTMWQTIFCKLYSLSQWSFDIAGRPPRASGKAPRARDAVRTSPVAWRQRLDAGVKEVEQTSSAVVGECDARFVLLIRGRHAGAGRRARDAHGPWRTADLADPSPVHRRRARKPLLCLIVRPKTLVERPILVGTRFKIPGTGNRVKKMKNGGNESARVDSEAES